MVIWGVSKFMVKKCVGHSRSIYYRALTVNLNLKRPFWGSDSDIRPTFWGDYAAGKVVIVLRVILLRVCFLCSAFLWFSCYFFGPGHVELISTWEMIAKGRTPPSTASFEATRWPQVGLQKQQNISRRVKLRSTYFVGVKQCQIPTCNLFVLYFGGWTLQNKALFKQNKGHLGSRYLLGHL